MFTCISTYSSKLLTYQVKKETPQQPPTQQTEDQNNHLHVRTASPGSDSGTDTVEYYTGWEKKFVNLYTNNSI